MAALVQRQLIPAAARNREQSAGAHLPFTRHADQHTVATRNGHLLQIIRLDGFAFETADVSEINHRKAVRETLLKGIADTHISLYHHIIRRRMDPALEGSFPSPFARELDAAWMAQLRRKRLYVNDHYLTVVRRGAGDRVGLAADFMGALMRGRGDAARDAADARNIKALTEAVDTLVTGLGAYGARRLGCYRSGNVHNSEPLEFLHELINGARRPVALPAMDLASYLPSKRLTFGSESIELRGAAHDDVTLAAIVSIKEYDAATAPGMIDHLLRLPFEFVLTQSFSYLDRWSRDEALYHLTETSFSIPLPEPDVQVSKHPALPARTIARPWVGLRHV